MTIEQLIDQYKKQPLFQAAAILWIIVCLIKIGTWGFEFGQWLKIY